MQRCPPNDCQHIGQFSLKQTSTLGDRHSHSPAMSSNLKKSQEDMFRISKVQKDLFDTEPSSEAQMLYHDAAQNRPYKPE